MHPTLRRLLLPWTPPAVLDWYLGRQPLYSGDYSTWEQATAAAGTYDQPAIFERVRHSSALVRDGKAVFERDGVVFDHIEHSLGLLTGLFQAAAAHSGVLNVLDFGGALGSSYRQCRSAIEPAVRSLRWNVVEQPEFVRLGKEQFENQTLGFYATMDECFKEQPINVALLSGVLPYLPQPHAMLDELIQHRPPYILLDRLMFLQDGPDRDVLTVQHVPASIYGEPLAYPAWFMSLDKLMAHFDGLYDVVFECETLTPKAKLMDKEVSAKALVLKRRHSF